MVKEDKKGFINESNLEFSDISAETHRIYTFPNGNVYRIENPQYLHVSKSGGHRIYTRDGYSHYVQPREGWAIKWQVHDGNPNFSK